MSIALARSLNRRMMVRLVKGAYWDTEIKRAQERGLDDYPVFTRKAMTDLNYVACARKLLRCGHAIFPQFATHNALTVATILRAGRRTAASNSSACTAWARALYAQLGEDRPDIAHRTYAPVGSHRDLLAYLVRRLLENGANSSFVALAADEAVPRDSVCCGVRPIWSAQRTVRTTRIFRCRSISISRSGKIRTASNSAIAPRSNKLVSAIAAQRPDVWRRSPKRRLTLRMPRSRRRATASGTGAARRPRRARKSCEQRRRPAREPLGAFHRAACSARAARRSMTRCREVREAVDFCRYYAAQGRKLFGTDEAMPGPTGESNALDACAAAASSSRSRRGIFRWRSSWAR